MLVPRLAQGARRRAATWRGQAGRSAGLSSSARCYSYDDTIRNLMVKPGAKVMVQGFTGRQSTFDCQQSLEFGTNIVGGVRPGKDGEHLGRPYFPTVRAAKQNLQPDATLVYVAAGQAAGAIEDAIKEEIPLIVAVAEHIPLHDMFRIQSMLRSQSKSRLVGANSPGMTSMHAKCRLGFQPLPFFRPGSVSIVAKSGTLSYEAIASTTEAGLGQSYAIGIGGDDLPGTSFVDALKVFEQDENTEGIIIIGEVGGSLELQAAEWIEDYRQRTPDPKPILTLLGGVHEVPNKVMGHDGAMRSRIDDTGAGAKLDRLRAAGAQAVRHPSYLGTSMKEALASRTKTQRRGIHTSIRHRQTLTHRVSPPVTQSRAYQINPAATQTLLEPLLDMPVTAKPVRPAFELVVEPRREFYKPGIHIRSLVAPSGAAGLSQGTLLFDVDGPWSETEPRLSALLDGFAIEDTAMRQRLHAAAAGLVQLYVAREGKRFVAQLGQAPGENEELALSATLDFDDWAFNMSKRQESIHKLERDASAYDAAEVEAATHGIVYLPRPSSNACVGTIVNGAGLAMNAVDNLRAWGLPATNFLDTGGKATAETVAASFHAVLADPRVRVLLVNIFGGLTRCDMIAEGILLAFKEVGVRAPLVVRLRGTNEADGLRALQDGARKMGVGEIKPGAAARVSGENGAGSGGMTAVRGFDEAMRALADALGVEAKPPGPPGSGE